MITIAYGSVPNNITVEKESGGEAEFGNSLG